MATECEEPIIEEPPLELPPITQQGANTFGCLINGEVWVPQGQRGGTGIKAFYQAINFLTIDASHFRQEQYAFFGFGLIDSNAVYEGNTFTLNDTVATRLNFETIDCEVDNYPDPSQVIAGQVTIDRFDFAKPFVAGQFWFIAITPECDTLRVTDGRFDVVVDL